MASVDVARDEASATSNKSLARLTESVAITVALLATFLGVCKVKDDNLVQAMQQAQADKLDHWAFYQAHNVREEVASAALVTLQLTASTVPATQQVAYREAVERYRALVTDQATKKAAQRAQAVRDQETYDRLNYRDDQFDLCDASLALAISLLALTALTRRWWLYWFSLVPTALGTLMGLAGLLNWQLHSDLLARLLS
jgi:hypothetical protein